MIDVPAYIAAAAQRGLELRAEGYGGDGLVDRTIREARLMADGQVSEDKVIRANAWAARHAIDLEAGQNTDPDADGWPGNGAVAHYLWGIDPTDPDPARSWFERQAEAITSAGDTMSESETPRARILEAEEREINGRQREVRVIGTGITVEERSADAPDGEPIRFHGYAAVFNSPSERLWDRANGEFTETIAPGAFKRTLGRDNDVRMYINHNSDQVLASTRSGTLNLAEDEHGLLVDAELPDTTYARDLANLMRSGVVDSMSFGFTVIDDTWQGDQRELREVALHEVSVVTGHPAYPETAGASVRSTDTDEQPEEPTRPLALAQRYHQLYSHKR